MKDNYGRELEYLRISLTDKCNLRCKYCMPKEGIKSINHSEILTLEEIIRLTRIFTSMGVKKVRLTGGEPLVRKNIMYLIHELSDMDSIESLGLTTNAILLEESLEELYKTRLRNINISLDTLNKENFYKITGFDGLDKVMNALKKCVSYGFNVKVNTVLLRGVNDSEYESIALLAKEEPVEVRFIELMPMGIAQKYNGIRSEEIIDKLGKNYKILDFSDSDSHDSKDADNNGVTGSFKETLHAPARVYKLQGFKGKIGFISPLSDSFCDRCNRLRLTSDGRLKTCLYYPPGLNLKELIRGGASDEEVKSKIKEEILRKPLKHGFLGGRDFEEQEKRNMNEIGG